MTAQEKVNKWRGLHRVDFFEELNGTKHQVVTLMAVIKKSVITSDPSKPLEYDENKHIDTFLLKSVLPNGEEINY